MFFRLFFGKFRCSQATASVHRDAKDYNMSHRKRGQAIIFNHKRFSSFNLTERTGTDVDRENLVRTLTALRFEVTVHNDKTWAEIRGELEKVSSGDHSDNDCILIAVLSHGERDSIWAKDRTYKLERLYSYFTADICPSLAGKPKLFVLQACQGDQVDAGVTLSGNMQTDSVAMSYRIPLQADFLIMSSSTPGYVSWRNGTDGSWFIRSLCEQLRNNGTRYDIMRLLTFVNQRVAIDFESYTTDPRFNRMKQMPCTTFMLTRILTFT